MFETDAEIFAFVKEHLYVPAVCDILDSLGYRNQAMHQRIRPLLPDIRNCGLIGRARTVRWMEVDYVDTDDPYGLEIFRASGRSYSLQRLDLESFQGLDR